MPPTKMMHRIASAVSRAITGARVVLPSMSSASGIAWRAGMVKDYMGARAGRIRSGAGEVAGGLVGEVGEVGEVVGGVLRSGLNGPTLRVPRGSQNELRRTSTSDRRS